VAKGERNKKNWRLVLLWTITFLEGDKLEENWPIQVPELPASFWLSLIYRDRKIRKVHGGRSIIRVEVRNPIGASQSITVTERRNEFGIAKLAYNRLVTSVKPTCPHCGKPISLEELGK